MRVAIKDPTAWMDDLTVWVPDDEIEGTIEQQEPELVFHGSPVAAAIWLSLVGIAAGAFAAVTFGAEIRSSVIAFCIYLLVAVLLLGGLRWATILLVGRPMVWHAGFTFFWAALLACGASLTASFGSSWLAYGASVGAGFFVGMVYGGVNPAVVKREDAWMGASLGMAILGTVLAALVYRNWLGGVDPLVADMALGAIAGGPFATVMAVLLFRFWDVGHGLRDLAMICLHNDNFAPKAVSYLDSALERSPADPELYTLRGIAWSRMDDPARAEADWQRASELAPDDARPHMNRGLDHLRRGETGAAVEALERALALAPRDFIVHDNLGLALERAGDHDRALQHFDQAISLEKVYANGYASRGNNRLRRGDYMGAIADCDRALKHSIRGLPKAYVIRGQALAALGRHDEAADSYEEAIEGDPSPEVLQEALRGREAQAAIAGRAAE
jgi:tetratricopeptide (TPR) repeat protein